MSSLQSRVRSLEDRPQPGAMAIQQDDHRPLTPSRPHDERRNPANSGNVSIRPQFRFFAPDFPQSVQRLVSEYKYVEIFTGAFLIEFPCYIGIFLFGSLVTVMHNTNYGWALLAVTAPLFCEAILRVFRYTFPVKVRDFAEYLMYFVAPLLLLVNPPTILLI